ncbi:hypothetical protein FHS66_000707 [Pacificitalea manganoxidans]|nr:hypothetical protein [Pacificitalea manganoxidans]
MRPPVREGGRRPGAGRPGPVGSTVNTSTKRPPLAGRFAALVVGGLSRKPRTRGVRCGTVPMRPPVREGGRGPGAGRLRPGRLHREHQHEAPSLGWALCRACGGRFISEAPDEGCAVWNSAKAPSRAGGGAQAGGWSPRPRWCNPIRMMRRAPSLGWALRNGCGQRFISEAPNGGWAVWDGAKAPSHGGGRARAGGWSPRPGMLKRIYRGGERPLSGGRFGTLVVGGLSRKPRMTGVRRRTVPRRPPIGEGGRGPGARTVTRGAERLTRAGVAMRSGGLVLRSKWALGAKVLAQTRLTHG